jgi:hypothetical protein
MTYLNVKTSYGIETIDELNRKDFILYKDYCNELRRLKNEYRLCGLNVYSSQRSTNEWKKQLNN